MHRGFNLRLPEWNNDALYRIGLELFGRNRSKVSKVLDGFRTKTGALDATKLQANWFPDVGAEIFISHSHADAAKAITFAGWLNKSFGLVSFVDSCVWGYGDDLLKLIDKDYCFQHESQTYDYDKRNRSTSHVHMLLAISLAQVIDNTECVFFLNTPKSLVAQDDIAAGKTQTGSPWIYLELAMTGLIRSKTIRAHRQRAGLAKAGQLNEELKVLYDVNLSHLEDLDAGQLNVWQEQSARKLGSNVHPLDQLYAIMRTS